MIEYKAYHKKSLGRPKKRHAARKAPKEKTRRARGARLRRALPVLAALLVVAAAGAAGAGVYSLLGHSRLFTVKEVDLNPCAHLTRDEVFAILGAGRGGSIWTLSAEEIGRRLRVHPWVHTVSVRKAFPDRLVVRIEERVPAAMINLDSLWYVDARGEIFKRLSVYDSKEYPIITGFSAADLSARDAVATANLRKTLELLALAEGGPLRKNVSEAHFDAQDGYTIVTRDTGLRLKIGTMNFREAMMRIEEALPQLSRLGQVQGTVDLKHAGRIFVRPGD